MTTNSEWTQRCHSEKFFRPESFFVFVLTSGVGQPYWTKLKSWLVDLSPLALHKNDEPVKQSKPGNEINKIKQIYNLMFFTLL